MLRVIGQNHLIPVTGKRPLQASGKGLFNNSGARHFNVWRSLPNSITKYNAKITSLTRIPSNTTSIKDFIRTFSSDDKPTGWEHFPKRDQEDKERGRKKSRLGKQSGDKEPSAGDWKEEILIALAAMGGLALLWYVESNITSSNEITWNEFQTNLLAKGKVKRLVVINQNRARVEARDELGHSMFYYLTIGSVQGFENLLEEAQNYLNIPSADRVPVVWHEEVNITSGLLHVVPNLLLIFLVWRVVSKNMAGRTKGGIFSIGKSKAKMFNKQDKVNVSFKDVAGLPEAKQEIQEFVDFLKSPKKYQDLGARIPKGALLVGPPGTGKTLLAKATAGEANVPFFSTSGSDFIEMFVGVGPSRVRNLFQQARENSPCIIFIDEIDAIGRARGKSGFHGGHDERENTLNQILVEMDGFTQSSGIVVLAGTNRPDVLDKALTRPGRFDRQIAIDKPDIKSRVEIFLVHLKPLKLDTQNLEEYAKKLASLTPGFSGADIANTCNEAALIAARRSASEVTLKDLEAAIDRIIGGLEKKNKVLSPTEKTTVAYHEAGHAIAGWFLEHADPVLKVSIVPRNTGLGYTQYLPHDEYIVRKDKLNDMMVMALAGRVAEELVFGRITTGAQDDLDKVTKIAYSQVKTYGMDESVGPLSFPSENGALKPYSDETAYLIDEKAKSLVQVAYQRSKALLTENRDGLEKLAKVLLEKEVIGLEDMKQMFGERPWPYPSGTKDFFSHQQAIEEREKQSESAQQSS